MDRLRKTYESLGLSNVTSYIQSGNVVFSSNSNNIKELEHQIFQQITTDFGFEVPVIVLSVEKLKQVINHNPFLNDPDKIPDFFHLTFLSDKPEESDYSVIEAKKQSGEEIIFSKDAVYLYCPEGYGKTKLTNSFLETRLKVCATTRNWKTVNELLQIGQNIP